MIGQVPPEFCRAADETFNSLGLKGDAAVETEFVTKEEIRELNARTRGIDRETDVLSFPMLDEIKEFNRNNYPYDCDGDKVMLGSIVICEEVAEEQAVEYGHSAVREKTYLFVHGLLHLLGYDHIDDNDRKKMRAAEERILSAIGISR